MENNSISIDVSKLDKMVEHYIDLKVNERKETHGAYNEMKHGYVEASKNVKNG